jgi:F-type H+-transporting ATPase subunit epsilon
VADSVAHPSGALRTDGIVDALAEAGGPFELVVVSPSRPIYEGPARFISIETAQGSMGIWPKHADIVAALGIGPLRIGLLEGGEHRFAIHGGFLKVTGDKIIVLVDDAVRRRELEEEPVRRELEETIANLQHPRSDEEFGRLLDQRAWCQARLDILSLPDTELSTPYAPLPA